MPTPPVRRPAPAVLRVLAFALVGACAALPPGRLPGDGSARPIRCPSAAFFPRDSAVVVSVPQGFGRIEIGSGHALEFDRDAVPPGSRYRVSRERADVAALRIEPIEGAPVRFRGLARLRVNVAACAADPGRPGFGLYRWEADGTLVPVPSAHSNGRVEALLDGFSVYAVGSN
jgi:hypothetical protein